MSRGRGFSSGYSGNYSGNFSRNLREDTPEDNHNRHVYDIGFQRNNSPGNLPIFSNSLDSRSGYDPTAGYYDNPRSNFNDNQTYYRSGMSPYDNREDHPPLPKRMRLDAYDYSQNDLVEPYQSNMLRNYPKRDDQYLPEYERNSNVSNVYHSFERESYNHPSPGHHHNNLREDINLSREARLSSSFSNRKEMYKSSRSSLPNTHRELHSHIERFKHRETRLERPRERLPRRTRLESGTAHKRSNLSSTSFDYRKNLKLEQFPNVIAGRAALKSGHKSGNVKKGTVKKNGNEPIEKESKVISKNEIIPDESTKSDKKNRKCNELVCPHCNLKYFTSTSYISHLQSAKHSKVFRQVAFKRNSTLAKIRVDQRKMQKLLEEKADDLQSSVNFCLLCKLNYQQSEAVHEASKYHNEIKEFVLRYCKICQINLNSHIAYENHICSLAHLKKKVCPDVNQIVVGGDDKRSSSEKMNILDEGNEKPVDVIDKPKKELVIVGKEKVCKVEVYYCELCNMYLPRVRKTRLEAVISTHCSKQLHLKNYYKYRRSNKYSNSEVLAKKDIKEEENGSQPKTVIDDVINNPDEEQSLVKKEHLENEDTLNGLKISENKSIDDVGKPNLQEGGENIEDQDESKNQVDNCIDNKEQLVIQEETPEKDDKHKENLEKLKNFENTIIAKVDKPILQEDHFIDDKQWAKDINQDLSDILEKAEKDKNEYNGQTESDQSDKLLIIEKSE